MSINGANSVNHKKKKKKKDIKPNPVIESKWNSSKNQYHDLYDCNTMILIKILVTKYMI